MDKASIEKLFELAKIEVTKEELEKFPREIDSIFAYISELEKVNVEHVSPVLSMAPLENNLRDDITEPLDVSIRNEIVAQFPDAKNEYLKTKNVFGEK